MECLRKQGKVFTLGTMLAVGGLGFVGSVAAEEKVGTERSNQPMGEAVQEGEMLTAEPRGDVGEPGTARSNQPHGDEVQEQKLLTGEPQGEVGEPGTERENLPTEDES